MSPEIIPGLTKHCRRQDNHNFVTKTRWITCICATWSTQSFRHSWRDSEQSTRNQQQERLLLWYILHADYIVFVWEKHLWLFRITSQISKVVKRELRWSLQKLSWTELRSSYIFEAAQAAYLHFLIRFCSGRRMQHFRFNTRPEKENDACSLKRICCLFDLTKLKLFFNNILWPPLPVIPLKSIGLFRWEKNLTLRLKCLPQELAWDEPIKFFVVFQGLAKWVLILDSQFDGVREYSTLISASGELMMPT